MSHSRRSFVRNSTAAAAAIGLAQFSPRSLAAASTLVGPDALPIQDPAFKDLAMRALEAAKAAGASYADVRISRNRTQNVFTRERRVQGVQDNETFGFGVRVLVNGAWGFAASSVITPDEIARVARQAARQAQASRITQLRPIALAPGGPAEPNGVWKSPIKVDPFEVPIEEKVQLLLAANEAALKVKGSRFCTSSMFFLREEKTYANTDGTYTVQTIYRAQPSMTVTAVSADFTDFQSRQSTDVQPKGLGYEHVTDANLVVNATKWAEQAVEKLSARPVDVGRYDLVLHPTHLWLTVHEACAHPTELDRALGYEANYAGTSFAAPPEKTLGKLKFGSELMNVRGDRSQVGSLSACGWDDEGQKPEDFRIIDKGILVNYHAITRMQAPFLEWWSKQNNRPVKSQGCSYSQSWADVQFERMPNVSLLPGTKEQSFEDLIAATDRGIAIVGDGSFSIDQQRYNAQFGGQLFYEIRGGKVVGMLKDVAYQIRTPEFWASMDMVGGPRSYELCGAFGDAKGQPSQSNAVSHGCVPTRHRQVNVINTGRTA
ncbi:MAG: TldD/PmbA family protein [Gemmatimonadaceae bacterium]|nr:TldD/PmbA family protein [Gemmatimonadaceae bacterium]